MKGRGKTGSFVHPHPPPSRGRGKVREIPNIFG